ncbi:esterase/lipase [Paenibacillus terrae HPL-003]|uniref:Esterase/lipase n=1 Tax=Paenibacillus terrae (strain HPL-003) TaxID=985665 RepID=G7VQY5_PAETH|nr:alpha/beta hydrolase [Paenibacillus terrae]AET61244.1 esterase/lipase [Paenibacillus terrae HPL-003]
MNKKLRMVSFALLATLAFATQKESFVAAESPPTDVIRMAPTYKDVVYATVPNDDGKKKELKMNIFKPEGVTEATPVLVYVHGGGWLIGDYQGDDAPKDAKKETVAPLNRPAQMTGRATDQVATDSAYQVFKKVLEDKITFVSIDYRLSGEAIFPAPIYDVKGSIRYLRAHAKEYGIDPEKIAVAGNSAGGHLATELAVTGDIKELEGDVGGNLEYSSKVMAAVDFYGPTDMFTMGPEMDPTLQSPEEAAETHDSPRAAEAKLLGFDKEGQGVAVLRDIRDQKQTGSPYWEKVKLAELASPINYVSSDDPPMFIAHGGRDSLVSIQQSWRLRDALNHAGVENIFMSNSKAPHGGQGEDVNNAAITWVTKKLLNK